MLSHERYVETFVELIRRASTRPPARRRARRCERGARREAAGGLAEKALAHDPRQRRAGARAARRPICQDTGTPLFVDPPPDRHVAPACSSAAFAEAVRQATAQAATCGPTRSTPSPARTPATAPAAGIPYLHFEEWDEPERRGAPILKGGGCENCGAQYTLPDARAEGRPRPRGRAPLHPRRGLPGPGQGLRAGRARRVLRRRPGAPAIVESKRQLLRPLDDLNPDPGAGRAGGRSCSRRPTSSASGPMGFGGKTTVLGVKIGRSTACRRATS